MAKKGQKFNSYSPELKLKYAKMLANGEASFREVAAELGTGKATVERWQDQYFKYGEEHVEFPNTVAGQWRATRPMEIVVSDMTILKAKNGTKYEWTYILDTFNNEIIESINGWIKEDLRINFNLKESNDVPKLIDEYVQYFNNERYSTKCKGKSPVQYRTELGY